MPNYENSKIYKIIDNTNGAVYIGSTTQSLSQRLASHRRDYAKYLKGNKSFITSFKIIQNNDYDIVLIEELSCETKEQLFAEERRHIENTVCVNKYIPLRTPAEYYQDNREEIKAKCSEYREANKERILERDKAFYAEHSKRINEKRKEQKKEYHQIKVVCECGATVCRGALYLHRSSKKHNDHLNHQEI